MTEPIWGPQPPCPEHAQAYRIVSAFFQKHRHNVVEIEVLPAAIAPPSGSPVLEDGLCLGVPKRLLVAAFIAACSIFFDKRAGNDPGSVQAALDATSVILLFDPEHLTAANFRRVQLDLFRATEDDAVARACVVQLELNFLDSILTSPLHRQSKSPTLWGYRAWIMLSFDPRLLLSRWSSTFEEPALSWDGLSRELGVVLKAAERHPKNYYAWQYARRLFDHLPTWQCIGQHQTSPQRPKPDICPLLAALGQDMLLRSVGVVHEWCLRNPSDTSAWSFLQFLLLRTPKRTELSPQLVGRTLSLAQDFHWKHESLWNFLRTVIADSRLISTDSRCKYILTMQSIYRKGKSTSSEAKAGAHPAETAALWILQNANI